MGERGVGGDGGLGDMTPCEVIEHVLTQRWGRGVVPGIAHRRQDGVRCVRVEVPRELLEVLAGMPPGRGCDAAPSLCCHTR